MTENKSKYIKAVMNWDDPKLHKLAGEFFRLFSRFEYALKANGYLRTDKKNAEADWTTFATEIDRAFEQLTDSDLKNAVYFLLNEPPQKQVNNNGQVDCKTIPPDSKNQTDLLLIYIRRIRNNLFHGGKFNGRWFEPQRSGHLIDASIEILNACLKVNMEVYEAYHG